MNRKSLPPSHPKDEEEDNHNYSNFSYHQHQHVTRDDERKREAGSYERLDEDEEPCTYIPAHNNHFNSFNVYNPPSEEVPRYQGYATSSMLLMEMLRRHDVISAPVHHAILGESLPVAASFHPSELFEPTPPPVPTGQEQQDASNDYLRTTISRTLNTDQSSTAGGEAPHQRNRLNSGACGQRKIDLLNDSLLHAASNPLNKGAYLIATYQEPPPGHPVKEEETMAYANIFHTANTTARTTNSAILEDAPPPLPGEEQTDDDQQHSSVQGSSSPTLLSQLLSSAPPLEEQNQPQLLLPNGDHNPSDAGDIFPAILYRLLGDLERKVGGTEIAAFVMPHGRSFIVKDIARFEAEVMPQYFPRMSKFASFQRQLNLYNFSRVSGQDPDRGAYYHDNFVRNYPDLASQMRRTKIKGLFTVPKHKRQKRKTIKREEEDEEEEDETAAEKKSFLKQVNTDTRQEDGAASEEAK